MARIKQFEVFAADLPFRIAFGHAAATRRSSESLFLKCELDSGTIGFGECLPRAYVTGESRDSAYAMLCERILPHLVGRSFKDLAEVRAFLQDCDGQAPAEWVEKGEPQAAAWCAVDLALLDAFARDAGVSLSASVDGSALQRARYSVVIGTGKKARSLLLLRLYGITQVKLKVDEATTSETVAQARKLLGRRCDLRIDANMAWDKDQTVVRMNSFADLDVRSVEQPLPVEQIEDAVELVRERGIMVMADESLNTRASLDQLIERNACTAINARISKCGGLTATLNRCRQALDAGLTVQIGCQVGESSLLSAAHLLLTAQVPEAKYLEGCFGERLLAEDVATPVLQFGYGGRPPKLPAGPGLGVTIQEALLRRHCGRDTTVEAG